MNKMGQQINMICEPDLPGIYFDDFNEFDTRNEQHSDLVPQSTSDRRTSMHQILPKNSYKCTVCNKLVKGSNQLLNHVRTHTGENSIRYQCKFCSNSFKEASGLNKHIKNHNLERYSKNVNSMRCCVCEINLPDPDLLRVHEENHAAEAPFRCRYCCSDFALLKQFKIHIHRHLQEIQLNQLKRENRNRDKNYNNSVQCTRCMQMVPKYLFVEHLRKHQESVAAVRNFIQPQRRLKCSLCHKVFAKSYNLKRHVLVHQKYGHDLKNYSSYSPTSSNSNNSENFNLPSELEVVKISNQTTKMFNRTLLKEPTSLTLTPALLSNLNKLTNRINSTEPKLGLKKPPILININTSNPAETAIEKNIKIEVPEIWKSQRNPINPIINSVSSNTVSSTASNLEDQLVNHGKKQIPLSSLQCLLCNKVLSEPFSLKVHMRTHTGERPFICFCGKSFSQSCNLNTHMRTHTSLKLFSCTFCEKSFTRASSLKGHLATHSKQKLSCLQCNISFENDVDAYTKHMKIKHLKAVDLMREEIKKISDAMAALKDQQNKVAGKVVQEETSVKSKTDNKEKETPRLMEVFEVQQSNGTPSGTIPKLKITIKKEPLNQKENSCNIETLVENNDDGNESDSSTSSSSSSSTSSSSSNSSSSSSNSSDNKNASNGNLSQPA